MDAENEILSKEYFKMVTDMIVLCTTLALSLFFWIVSLTLSVVSGKPPAGGERLPGEPSVNLILLKTKKSCAVLRISLKLVLHNNQVLHGHAWKNLTFLLTNVHKLTLWCSKFPKSPLVKRNIKFWSLFLKCFFLLGQTNLAFKLVHLFVC